MGLLYYVGCQFETGLIYADVLSSEIWYACFGVEINALRLVKVSSVRLAEMLASRKESEHKIQRFLVLDTSLHVCLIFSFKSLVNSSVCSLCFCCCVTTHTPSL